MKAYYIDIWEDMHVADIDIGIGSIAYVEEWHYDMIIVAKNRKEAWHMFNAYNVIETKCTGNIRPSDFRSKANKNPLDQDAFGLLFITIAESVETDRFERIEKMSGDPLCAIVQHHPYIAYTARYQYGHGKPLWSNEKESPAIYPSPEQLSNCDGVIPF